MEDPTSVIPQSPPENHNKDLQAEKDHSKDSSSLHLSELCDPQGSSNQKVLCLNHFPVDLNDSCPPPPNELDTPSPSFLNSTLSSLASFVPENMLEKLKSINISKLSSDTLDMFNLSARRKDTPESDSPQNNDNREEGALISDDETVLFEDQPASPDRYSELMVSPASAKTTCSSIDSGVAGLSNSSIKTNRSPTRTIAAKISPRLGTVASTNSDGLNDSLATLCSDVSWLNNPVTSSKIGNKNVPLPNISLTSISSQVWIISISYEFMFKLKKKNQTFNKVVNFRLLKLKWRRFVYWKKCLLFKPRKTTWV